jgi:hypothetical protein
MMKIDADGTIHVPAFKLPLSPCLSEAARQSQIGGLLRSTLAMPRLEGLANEAVRSSRAQYMAGASSRFLLRILER